MSGTMNAHLRDGRWMPCRSMRGCAYKTTIFHDAEAMRACNDLMDALCSGHDPDKAARSEAMRRILFLEAGGGAIASDGKLAERIRKGGR